MQVEFGGQSAGATEKNKPTAGNNEKNKPTAGSNEKNKPTAKAKAKSYPNKKDELKPAASTAKKGNKDGDCPKVENLNLVAPLDTNTSHVFWGCGQERVGWSTMGLKSSI